ncbi:transposase [uncultured Tateyamaria sp.]|uniref:IS66 family transposase n=1 Tax=uncultured Tateyamaria sp. TaxID=455651 RepID=UPI002618D16D|nr:transposase [uncultured Tateyamaria sp.]
MNRMPKARGYLDDGRLELDNNTCERSLRPVTLGHKTISSWYLSAAAKQLLSPILLSKQPR